MNAVVVEEWFQKTHRVPRRLCPNDGHDADREFELDRRRRNKN